MPLQASVHVKDGNVSGAYASQAKNVGYENTNVEAALDSIMPRTATGTTLAQLVTATGKLSEEQKDNCVIKIDFRRLRRISSNVYNFTTLSGTEVVEIKLDTSAGTYKQYINNGSVNDLSITSWTIYYQGTPID